jgi:hypothetical protein
MTDEALWPAVSTAAVSLFLIPCVAGAQLNYAFMKDAPAAKFDDEDRGLLRSAVAQTLDDADPHSRHEWTNPKTKHSGTVESVAAFVTSDHRTCKRLRLDNRADAGIRNRSEVTLCKSPSGEWRVDGAAKEGG